MGVDGACESSVVDVGCEGCEEVKDGPALIRSSTSHHHLYM